MLELKNIAQVLSGVSVRESKGGSARFMRLADLSDLRAGREPILAVGEMPAVARALTIEPGDLVVGARGSTTDVCLGSEPIFGAFVSVDLYLVRPDQTRVNPQYLVAFLELPATQVLLSTGKQGSGLARLAKDALETLQISLPPLDHQQMIACLAQAFNQEDRLLRKLSELNSIFGREAMARAIRLADTNHDFTRNIR